MDAFATFLWILWIFLFFFFLRRRRIGFVKWIDRYLIVFFGFCLLFFFDNGYDLRIFEGDVQFSFSFLARNFYYYYYCCCH